MTLYTSREGCVRRKHVRSQDMPALSQHTKNAFTIARQVSYPQNSRWLKDTPPDPTPTVHFSSQYHCKFCGIGCLRIAWEIRRRRRRAANGPPRRLGSALVQWGLLNQSLDKPCFLRTNANSVLVARCEERGTGAKGVPLLDAEGKLRRACTSPCGVG